MSRSALKKFTKTVRANPRWFTPDGAAEDVCMGLALTRQAIFVDERDDNLQKRFFPVGVTQHLQKGRKEYWYFKWLYYDVPQGSFNCCSDVPIQFHYTKPPSLYFHEYVVYHAHPFGVSKNLTETLPRKLSLREIIAASDSDCPKNLPNHTNDHQMFSSEVY